MKCGEGKQSTCCPTILWGPSLVTSLSTFTAWCVIHIHATLVLWSFSYCSVVSMLLTDTCLSTRAVGRQRHSQPPPL